MSAANSASRRRFRGRRAGVAVVAAGVGLVVALLVVGGVIGGGIVGAGGGRIVDQIPWRLVAVSPDARTLSIGHEIPHCTTEPGDVQVVERTDAVDIALPEVTVGGLGEGGCTADGRFGTTDVTLARPLGRRELRQPSPGGEAAASASVLFGGEHPGAKECARLQRLPADAPARDVPWVERRLRFCAAPLPRALRALPILRRDASPDDRLPSPVGEKLAEADLVVRESAVRQISPGQPAWLVPGPHQTCIGRLVDGDGRLTSCAKSTTIARRGVFVSTTCSNRTPKRVQLVGLVPAAVDRITLRPKRGPARVVSVGGDGTWSASTAYPLEVAYGGRTFKSNYLTRACWY